MVVPEQAPESPRRDSILVAEVSRAPLLSLVAAKLLLVVSGIVLTAITFISPRGETGEVQARPIIPALVAAHFEGSKTRESVKSVEDMFEKRDSLFLVQESGLRKPKKMHGLLPIDATNKRSEIF